MKVDREMLSLHLSTALDDRESRYPLKAVSIESDGTAVATDGRHLVAIEPQDWKADTDEKSFFLRADDCKNLLKQISKARSKAEFAHVDCEPLDDGQVRVTFNKPDSNGNLLAVEHTYVPVDEPYPDWRGALDHRIRLPADGKIMVDLDYLETICAIFRQFKAHAEKLYVELQVNVDGPLVMRAKNTDDNRRALAVVMPVVNQTADSDGPLSDWEEACVFNKRETVADAAD